LIHFDDCDTASNLKTLHSFQLFQNAYIQNFINYHRSQKMNDKIKYC